MEDAENSYRAAIKIEPKFMQALANLGVLLVKLERFDEAEKLFRTAVGHKPEDEAALENLGNLLKMRGRLEEADEIIDKRGESGDFI